MTDLADLLATWESASPTSAGAPGHAGDTAGDLDPGPTSDAPTGPDRQDLLAALAANAALVERLTAGRWLVMHRARQAGASWQQIGEALGVSRQSAWELVRRRTG